MIPEIKIALWSDTFAKRCSRWTVIPSTLDEISNDVDYYNATIHYLVKASRYQKCLNEQLSIIFKETK